MNRFLPLLSVLSLILLHVCATKHHLFVGNLFEPAVIYGLEFDDNTYDFRITSNITADAPHAWITFDPNKSNIYGVSLQHPRISSYSVTSPSTLSFSTSLSFAGNCTNKTSAFVLPNPTSPHDVYTFSYPGPSACGSRFSVHPNGSLASPASTWTYYNTSGVHGAALRPPSNAFQNIYSADLTTDTIWTHVVDPSDGDVIPYIVDLSNQFDAPMRKKVADGSHPRHMIAHPGGGRVYVIMEASNQVVEFRMAEHTGWVSDELGRWNLIPEGKNASDYWSAEVALSSSNKYLWATSRALANATYPGYISAFSLSNGTGPDGGHILSQLFMVPTTTNGGIANQIAPAPFSDDFFTLADNPKGYVQMWKVQKSANGTLVGAEVVAQVDMRDGGCCANVLWYD